MGNARKFLRVQAPRWRKDGSSFLGGPGEGWLRLGWPWCPQLPMNIKDLDYQDPHLSTPHEATTLYYAPLSILPETFVPVQIRAQIPCLVLVQV